MLLQRNHSKPTIPSQTTASSPFSSRIPDTLCLQATIRQIRQKMRPRTSRPSQQTWPSLLYTSWATSRSGLIVLSVISERGLPCSEKALLCKCMLRAPSTSLALPNSANAVLAQNCRCPPLYRLYLPHLPALPRRLVRRYPVPLLPVQEHGCHPPTRWSNRGLRSDDARLLPVQRQPGSHECPAAAASTTAPGAVSHACASATGSAATAACHAA